MLKIADNIDNIEELSEGAGRMQRLPINITRKRWVLIKDEKEILCGSQRNHVFKPLDDVGNRAIKTFRTKKESISYLKNYVFKYTIYENMFEISDDYIKYFNNYYVAVEVTEVIK
jgi:hypothetical protein